MLHIKSIHAFIFLFFFSHSTSILASIEVKVLADDTFAVIGESVINAQEYQQALKNQIKNKYYHGKIPEGEMIKVEREMGEKLLTNVMLLQEGKRRGYKPDENKINNTLELTLNQYKKKYGESERWDEFKSKFIPEYNSHLKDKSIVAQVEDSFSDVDEPNLKTQKKYYQENKDKFTTPEKLKVSVILLQVDPSSPIEKWDEAMDQGRDIYRQLQNSIEFEALAKKYSKDPSAINGGDMGYLHTGMLSPQIQHVLDGIKKGEISKPVKLLKGVAIFRLDDRKSPVVNDFDTVSNQVVKLWKREQTEINKKQLINLLWKSTSIKVNSKYYISK